MAFIVYGLTKSMVFITYAIVALITYVITLINIQPFKTTASRFHSTDTIFYILLGLCYIALVGRDVEDRENMLFNYVMLILAIVSAFVPIAYIIGLVGFWLFSVVVKK